VPQAELWRLLEQCSRSERQKLLQLGDGGYGWDDLGGSGYPTNGWFFDGKIPIYKCWLVVWNTNPN